MGPDSGDSASLSPHCSDGGGGDGGGISKKGRGSSEVTKRDFFFTI